MSGIVEIFGGLTLVVVMVFLVVLALLTFIMPFVIYGIRCHTKEAKDAALKTEKHLAYLVKLANALYVEDDDDE